MNAEQKLARTVEVPIALKRMKIGDFEINFAVAGGGPESVLLIHGGNIGWGQWYPNIAAFAKHFTVYAPDLPGGGRSTTVDFSKIDFEKDLVEVVSEFVRRSGLQKFHIVATSNGGWIALKIALKHPEKIGKIVVADAVGLGDYVSIPDRIMSLYPFAAFLSRTVFRPRRQNRRLEGLLRSVFHDAKAPLRPEFVDYFYETMQRSHNMLFISRLAREVKNRRLSLRDELPRVLAETLIIWGGNDKLMPLAKFSENFSKIPRHRVHIIEGAGHMPSIEKPEEFNEKVITFLQAQA